VSFAILNQYNLVLSCQSFDIFFSHAWVNKDFLSHVYHFLYFSGYRVWYDQNDMGYDLDNSMHTGIKNSQVTVVCLSRKYQSSHNCLKELKWAVNEGKPVIVLLLEKYDVGNNNWISDEIKEFCSLDNHMYVDLSFICALDFKIENGIEFKVAKLRSKLSPLKSFLDEFKCYPSIQL
jgi:hypothetical protein